MATRRCAAGASERCAASSSIGADHVLFASDAPFGPEGGAGYIRSTMKVMASLDLSNAEKEKICWRNAISFFGLKS